MPVLSQCCCCSLQGGAKATSIYSMIYAALAIGFAAYKVHHDEMAGVRSLNSENYAFFIATCVDISFFSLLFLLSLLLLYGIKNHKRYLFLPFIVCMVVLIILMIILMLLLIIILVSAVYMDATVVFELLIVGFFTGLNIYCVLCVISLYQELRDGRANMRAIYQAQGAQLHHNAEAQPLEKMGELNNLENANFVPQYPMPSLEAAALYPGPPVPMGAPPPPYQPPVYPAQTYPKAELQHL